MAKDAINIGIEVGRRILVQAKGHPAKVIGYGCAAAIASVGAAAGYAILKRTDTGRRLLRGGKGMKRS